MQRVTHSLFPVTLQRASHLAPDLCARGCTRFPRERAAFTAVDEDERVGSRVGEREAAAERQEEEWRGAADGGTEGEGVRGQVRTNASSKPWHSPPHGVHRSCRPRRRATRTARSRRRPCNAGRKRERREDSSSRVSCTIPSLRSPFRLSLSRRDCGGRAQMYEPNEIDAKKRAEVPETPGTREHVHVCVCLRVWVRASVFSTRFITELLMLRDKGKGPRSPFSTSAYSCRCRRRRRRRVDSTSYLLAMLLLVSARRLIPGCHAITSWFTFSR